MNQHGAPSAASPHRLTAQSLPKQQHRVKQRLRFRVVENNPPSADFQSFFDTSLGLQPREKESKRTGARPRATQALTKNRCSTAARANTSRSVTRSIEIVVRCIRTARAPSADFYPHPCDATKQCCTPLRRNSRA